MAFGLSGDCEYYGKLCTASGGSDEYACNTQKCCEDFGNSLITMCIRQCLIIDDVLINLFPNLTYDEINALRYWAHYHCYGLDCSGGRYLGLYVKIFGAPDSCNKSMEIVEDAVDKDLSSFSSAMRKLDKLFK
ncbi:MAG: hypothetical protein HQK95_01890 [Nitrospirae bacterium]|nr:hypothetical protein [Nitrospirota bacterium]